MNDNPKNNILMSKNIRQKNILHRNIPGLLAFFVIFSDIKCYFSDYRSYSTVFCNCQEEMVFYMLHNFMNFSEQKPVEFSQIF